MRIIRSFRDVQYRTLNTVHEFSVHIIFLIAYTSGELTRTFSKPHYARKKFPVDQNQKKNPVFNFLYVPENTCTPGRVAYEIVMTVKKAMACSG